MEREKLEKLLDHWIDHSCDHTQKYAEWARDLKNSDPAISECLFEAVSHFEKGERFLKEARNLL